MSLKERTICCLIVDSVKIQNVRLAWHISRKKCRTGMQDLSLYHGGILKRKLQQALPRKYNEGHLTLLFVDLRFS